MPAQSPAAALSLLDQGDLSAARDLVAQALAQRLEADAARAWARVAEAGGFSLLAVQAWQAVLAGGAADVEALEALVPLHEARGDERRARACQQRLADLGRGPRPTSAVEAPEGAPEPLAGEPEPGDLVRFCHRLGGRAGVHARQWWEAGRGGEPGRGGYSPVQSPLSPELVAAHLAGGMTLGVYLVRHDDTVGQLIFDLDARKSAVEAAWGDPERARGLRERIHRAGLSLLSGLRRAGFDPLLVDSGYKGRHLWCLFPQPVPAAVARGLGLAWVRALAPADPDLVVEVFPRQDKVPAGGLGNLVKLPLGLHRRTDRRCHILDDAGAPVADPWARLRQLRAVDPSAIAAPGEPPAPTPSPLPTEAPLPAPAPVGASPFTEADFEARPRLASVLAGCPVLRLVVDRALREKDLPGAAHNVLEHSLGHLPEGVHQLPRAPRRPRGGRDEAPPPRLAGILRTRAAAPAGRGGAGALPVSIQG